MELSLKSCLFSEDAIFIHTIRWGGGGEVVIAITVVFLGFEPGLADCL